MTDPVQDHLANTLHRSDVIHGDDVSPAHSHERYVVVTMGADGHMSPAQFLSRADLIEAMAATGHAYTGDEHSTRLRSELIGQPTFAGLGGPMWGGYIWNGQYTDPDAGGVPTVRYEDYETARVLST